jgi:hypothetical protein
MTPHMYSAGVRRGRSRITLKRTRAVCVAGRGDTKTRRVVQLDERRPRLRTALCGRCKRRVLLRTPWRHWRQVRSLWFATLIASLPLLPALAFDACFMLPAFMLFLMAIGPLNELARQRPSCARCGICIDDDPPPSGAAPVLALRRQRRHRAP